MLFSRWAGPKPTDPNLNRYIGPPLHETFRELLGTSSEQEIETAIAHYRERFADVGILENALYPGIPQALSELAERGHELLVATSKPHVSRVCGSELSGERADKGDLIPYVLEAESLEACSSCMIGDRRHDILGAQRHGVLSVGVLRG